jgi:hypothetical protein
MNVLALKEFLHEIKHLDEINCNILDIVWEGIPLYQMYLYKKGFRTISHGTTQVMKIHVVEVVLADIRMVLKLMCATALA